VLCPCLVLATSESLKSLPGNSCQLASPAARPPGYRKQPNVSNVLFNSFQYLNTSSTRRGGAEVALGLHYKTFLTYRTCMGSAPARPERACFVRSCCGVVVQEHDLRATPVQCNAKRRLSSHFTLHSSHPALHISQLHFALHTSSHLRSCEFFSSHLISALLISSHRLSHVI
jgi:hypothetical protein